MPLGETAPPCEKRPCIHLSQTCGNLYAQQCIVLPTRRRPRKPQQSSWRSHGPSLKFIDPGMLLKESSKKEKVQAKPNGYHSSQGHEHTAPGLRHLPKRQCHGKSYPSPHFDCKINEKVEGNLLPQNYNRVKSCRYNFTGQGSAEATCRKARRCIAPDLTCLFISQLLRSHLSHSPCMHFNDPLSLDLSPRFPPLRGMCAMVHRHSELGVGTPHTLLMAFGTLQARIKVDQRSSMLRDLRTAPIGLFTKC